MQTIDQLQSGQLASIQRLKLSSGLTNFPMEIIDLADTLEILDLSGNRLSSLPLELTRLKKLRILFCSNNLFTELPEVLGLCPELSMVGFKANQISKLSGKSLPSKIRWLILTDNEIEELPSEIGNCLQLQKLMLAGNKIKVLPPSLANCKNLELLRIAANQLNMLPSWLLTLPRLAWLAYSGNPFSALLESEALSRTIIDNIPWNSLEFNYLLGEGASGVIHHARYRSADNESFAVAVKMFKGSVTSDGLPHCEMAAAICAGKHPDLINVIGKVSDHPLAASGLVMELIETAYKNLAGPPSFDSCTRDIYASDTCFDLQTLLLIVRSISSAAAHLHKQGIMHGDLYAHNILYSSQGRALLGDFGAASFYAADYPEIGYGLQRLEVRAFGYLLEELLERCRIRAEEREVLNLLNELKLACLSEESKQRPLFDKINSLIIDAICNLNG